MWYCDIWPIWRTISHGQRAIPPDPKSLCRWTTVLGCQSLRSASDPLQKPTFLWYLPEAWLGKCASNFAGQLKCFATQKEKSKLWQVMTNLSRVVSIFLGHPYPQRQENLESLWDGEAAWGSQHGWVSDLKIGSWFFFHRTFIEVHMVSWFFNIFQKCPYNPIAGHVVFRTD